MLFSLNIATIPFSRDILAQFASSPDFFNNNGRFFHPKIARESLEYCCKSVEQCQNPLYFAVAFF
jgi:hypothetical protein